MTTFSSPGPAARLLDGAIGLYQRHGSTYTCACAVRVLHGRASCSSHARRVIRRHGVWTGMRLVRRRLRRCRRVMEAWKGSHDGYAWASASAACAAATATATAGNAANAGPTKAADRMAMDTIPGPGGATARDEKRRQKRGCGLDACDFAEIGICGGLAAFGSLGN